MIKKTKIKEFINLKSLKKIAIGFCLFTTLPVSGQSKTEILQEATTTSTTASAMPTSLSILTENMSVGLNLGLVNGIGLDIAYAFNEHWASKLAYNFADFTKRNYTYDINYSTNGVPTRQTLSFDIVAKFSNLALTAEYSPKVDGRLKFMGGLAYFPKNTLIVGAQILTIIKLNDVSLNPEDLGSGTVQVGFNRKVSPFVGIGYGRTFPKKRVNISCDVGTYYKTAYKVVVHVNPGIVLKKNEENGAVLTRNFNEKWYGKFWPVLNMRLAYRLR